MTKSLTLSEEELFEITGYRRGHEQLQWLKQYGVLAKRRPDGTMSVAREHYMRHGTKTAAPAVESRPRLQSEKRRAS